MPKDDSLELLEENLPDTVSMRLKCGKCGHVARYKTNTVYIDPELQDARPEDSVSFGSYFRCRKCKSAGPWGFTADATLAVTALMFTRMSGLDDDRLIFGSARMYDGTRFRSAAQAEDYLLGILEREPDNSLVWNKLANTYFRADLMPKASKAFAKALELDPTDLESHYSLGGILFDRGSYKRSAEHLHQVMVLSRSYSRLPADEIREMVTSALWMLSEMRAATNSEIDIMPQFPASDERATSDEPRTIHMESFELDKERDRERLVDLIMGKTQRPSPLPVARPLESRTKIGRNEPCPCGSGAKYKKCCGK